MLVLEIISPNLTLKDLLKIMGMIVQGKTWTNLFAFGCYILNFIPWY